MPWKTTIGESDHPEPLLYMPFWQWQMDYMKSELTNLEPDLTALSDFGYQENTEKKARIVSQCYKSSEYRKIRMTYYDAGDNTQVFNSVWYPDPKYNLPILGIDLLAFNRKKYLAIVDFQPLYANEDEHAQAFTHRLAPIKNQYQSLKGQMSSKFYDETQFFSKQMLFARFEEEKIVQKDLYPAFKRYVMMHNRLLKDTRPHFDPELQERVLSRHVAYDTYSAERDPATGLFAAMFGKEWADDYVFDFLFSLSERQKEGSEASPLIKTSRVENKTEISSQRTMMVASGGGGGSTLRER
jgi:15,16-dihydrobiliverdin:ferredoxin oxidoreductase